MYDDFKNRPLAKMLVVIMDWNKAERIVDLFKQNHLVAHYQFHAEGTVKSNTIDMLGLSSTEKVVSVCISNQHIIKHLENSIANKLSQMKSGKGIAFTLPLSGVGGFIIRLLNSELYEKLSKHMESEVTKVKKDVTHDLVLAVINQGYSEELMNSAKAGGATGGTVVHARRVGMEDSIKYLGISIQAEKEIVAILVKHDDKINVMKAISHSCGINTNAQGIIFSMPVDSIAGEDGESGESWDD